MRDTDIYVAFVFQIGILIFPHFYIHVYKQIVAKNLPLWGGGENSAI